MGPIVLILFFLLSGVGLARAQDVEVRPGIAYGPHPAEVLDVCLPPGRNMARAGVVLMHGGGWGSGSRETMRGDCRYFASQGLVVANIDYRLTGPQGGPWPAQLEDAQLAVRWLRSHAAEYGLDPRRICGFGDSAGAHLAVFLAVLQRTMPGDRASDLANVSSAVACAVDNFGPVDFTVPTRFHGAMRRFAGTDDPARVQAVSREASPLLLVSPATAPIMIVQGTKDALVWPDQATALRDALLRAHVRVVYRTYPGGHEFKGISRQEKFAILQSEAAFIESAPPLAH